MTYPPQQTASEKPRSMHPKAGCVRNIIDLKSEPLLLEQGM